MIEPVRFTVSQNAIEHEKSGAFQKILLLTVVLTDLWQSPNFFLEEKLMRSLNFQPQLETNVFVFRVKTVTQNAIEHGNTEGFQKEWFPRDVHKVLWQSPNFFIELYPLHFGIVSSIVIPSSHQNSSYRWFGQGLEALIKFQQNDRYVHLYRTKMITGLD